MTIVWKPWLYPYGPDLLNFSGITLGGAYSGMHVNYGTTFSVSHWLIQRVDSVGTPRPSLLWKVRSTAPGITAFSGVTTISHGELSVSSNEWGTGTSLHMTKYSYRGNDEAHALLRNTITFWVSLANAASWTFIYSFHFYKRKRFTYLSIVSSVFIHSIFLKRNF